MLGRWPRIQATIANNYVKKDSMLYYCIQAQDQAQVITKSTKKEEIWFFRPRRYEKTLKYQIVKRSIMQ